MSKQPNILFLFSDQQRADSVHCYGQPLALTPNLDRLAAEGVRFAEAHTPQPVCGPARACLQSGQWATRCGVHRNALPLPTDRPLLALALREVGYEAGYIGKWHLASDRRGLESDVSYRDRPVPVDRRGGYLDFWLAADALEHTSHGYDGHMWDANGCRWDFPEGRYRVDAITDWLLDYLRTRDEERPWFCFASWIEPHHQNGRGRIEGPHGSSERFANAPIPVDLQKQEGDWPEKYADYLGCVASLDENVGRILRTLEETGQLENTLIIYTSDHGCHFRTRNSEYKRSCHRASTHVPCIVRGPGFTGGRVVEELISLLDLPPTLLRAAGAPIPDSFDGLPLQDLLADSIDWPTDVFVQISESQIGRCLRTAEWCYSIKATNADAYQDATAEHYVEEALYDQHADPHELDNRVADPTLATVRAELRARIRARMRAAGEPESFIES